MPALRSAAEYNRHVWIEQNTASNATGQLVGTWYPYLQVWAQIVTRSGRERRVFEQLRPEVDLLLRIRFSKAAADIIPINYRVNFGGTIVPNSSPQTLTVGQIFNIASVVDVDFLRTELELHCIEIKRQASK